MDRQIEQTYAPVWRLIKITGTMFLFVLIVCGGIAYLNGQQNLKYLFTGLAIMGFGLTIILSLAVFVVSGQGAKWFVTENGLKRVQLSGVKKTILWKQIYHMANKGNGLFIRWVDIAPPGTQVAREALERRAVFYPDKSEVHELIALWQQKTSRQSQPKAFAHFRPNTSRTARVTFALILAGIVLIGWVVITIVQQYPSTSWPWVEGKIISQEYHLLPPGRNTVASAQLKLSYEYQVSGQTYHADRYNLWHQIYQNVNDAVLDFADAHPTNASIKVYYNPKNPAQAVLVTGPDWSANITLAISGFFLAFIGFAIRAIQRPAISHVMTNRPKSK